MLRGQFISSNCKLAEAWGWSEKTVRRFIKWLEKEGMVVCHASNKFSVLEVTKYAEYQSTDITELQPTSCRTKADQKPNKRRARAEQMPTNNNDNNVNNEKNDNNIYRQIDTSISDFIQFRKSIKKPMTDRAITLFKNKLNKLAQDDETKIAIIDQSILKGWTDIYPLKGDSFGQNSRDNQQDKPGKYDTSKIMYKGSGIDTENIDF